MELVIVFTLALSVLLGFLGMDRKFGFWGYFFCSLAFTPLITLLILLASDRRKPG